MDNPTLGYIGVAITTLAFAFAIWQYLQNRKIKRIISLEAIELHQSISIALGAAQDALKAVRNSRPPAIDIGRAEGLTNAALIGSAKLFCNLRKTTLDDIQEMVNNNQINANYQNIFDAFSDRKRGIIRRFLRYILRLY